MIHPLGQRGFTLLELITILILAGILAAVFLPRFNNDSLEQRGYLNALQTNLRYAQQVAIAGRRFVCADLTLSSGDLALSRDGELPDASGKTTISCELDLAMPVPVEGCAANTLCAPSGMSLTSSKAAVSGVVALVFDPLGRLVSAPNVLDGNVQLTVNSLPPISIVAETGNISYD